MTIRYMQGNLFNSNADAYAHGCNTAGIMASCIAKTFHEEFPDMFDDYKRRCSEMRFLPGMGYVYFNTKKPHVINLATQADDREAKLEYVNSAFDWMSRRLPITEIKSVAMPRIASGLGGLIWDDVSLLLNKHFRNSELEVEIWTLGGNHGNN